MKLGNIRKISKPGAASLQHQILEISVKNYTFYANNLFTASLFPLKQFKEYKWFLSDRIHVSQMITFVMISVFKFQVSGKDFSFRITCRQLSYNNAQGSWSLERFCSYQCLLNSFCTQWWWPVSRNFVHIRENNGTIIYVYSYIEYMRRDPVNKNVKFTQLLSTMGCPQE